MGRDGDGEGRCQLTPTGANKGELTPSTSPPSFLLGSWALIAVSIHEPHLPELPVPVFGPLVNNLKTSDHIWLISV